MTDIHVGERHAGIESKLREEQRAEHLRQSNNTNGQHGPEGEHEACLNGEGDRGIARASSRHVEGYEGVLLRSDVKTKLRAFKESVGAHEKHLERCLVTAAIEIMLETPRLKEAWLERMARAVATDTRLVLKTRQRNNKSEPFFGGERS